MNKMRSLPFLLAMLAACDAPSENITFRGDDPHLPPQPTEICAEILRVDLRPQSGQGAFRSVVVSSLQCEGTNDGLKLTVGRGPLARPIGEEHNMAFAYPLPADECYEVGGIEVDSAFDLFDATCFPDGDWSTFHVVLKDGANNVLDTVEMPFDLGSQKLPTAPLRKQKDGTWVVEKQPMGCEYAP